MNLNQLIVDQKNELIALHEQSQTIITTTTTIRTTPTMTSKSPSPSMSTSNRRRVVIPDNEIGIPKAPNLLDKSFLNLDNYEPKISPTNPQLFFHNKMPRSGSTTFANLIDVLSRKNNFHLLFLKANLELTNEPRKLVEHVENTVAKIRSKENELKREQTPIIVLKHHNFLNFTFFGNRETQPPTYINIARNPIDRFISHYYISRYGTVGSGQPRGEVHGEMDLTIEDFFEQIKEEYENKPDKPDYDYLYKLYGDGYYKWFCGIHPLCQAPTTIIKSCEYAKYIILNEYFTIGLLEEFSVTLQLFEKLMPRLFLGAEEVYYSENVRIEKAKKISASAFKTGISNETRKWLEQGIFRHDMDLYRFIEAKFWIQVDRVFNF